MKKVTELSKLRLLSNRVLILPDPTETITKSGLFIPGNAQEKPVFGKVIKAGKEHNAPKSLIAGIRVLYGKYSGTEVELDGTQYLIMPETEVWGIETK